MKKVTQNTIFFPDTGRHNALSYSYVWHFRCHAKYIAVQNNSQYEICGRVNY